MKKFGLNSLSLSIFRIFIGAILLYDLFWNKIIIYESIYNHEKGILGMTFLNSALFKSTFFSFLPTNSDIKFLLVISLIVYPLFLLGLYHKYTKPLTFTLFTYISHKSSLLLIGADLILSSLLLFSIFLPLDTHLCFNKDTTNIPYFRSFEIRNIAVWGILIQIGCIYFCSAVNKNGDMWLQGNAVNVVMADTITSQPLSKYFINSYVTKLMCYSTYVYEFLFIFILFTPYKNQQFRLLLSVLVLVFHIGIQIFMNIGHFYLVFIAISILLLPSIFWDNIFLKKHIQT